MNRRQFLGDLAVFGAGALVAGGSVHAQRGTRANPRRIDFHHHFELPEVLAMQGRGGGRGRGGAAPPTGRGPAALNWTLAQDLDDMDRNGTATALMSGFLPTNADVETQRKAARLCNEFMAKLRSDHPQRFGIFAALPVRGFDIDGSLREIEYAVDTLKADGFHLLTSYGDVWTGDERFFPVYEELNRRKAVVHVHPQAATCCSGLSVAQKVPNQGPMIEYGTDTTRVIANLTYAGTAARFSGITWVFSHAGGVMPYLIERFFQSGASAEVVPGIMTRGQAARVGGPPAMTGDQVLQQLRRFYYDTAQASNPVAMDALKKVATVSQIVYGTDYWYRTAEETGRGLITSRVFNEKELYAVNRGNAERLLPRYRA